MARTVKPGRAASGGKRRAAKAEAPSKAAGGNGIERLKAERLALARELASARRRIAELEKERNAVAERIEIAINSIHKVLKTHH